MVAGVHAHSWSMEEPAKAEALLDQIRPDQVFHLASPVVLKRDPQLLEALRRQIVEGGKALVLACESSSTPVVVAGTCEEYGDNKAPFSEEMPARPVSPYSVAKAELSAWVMERTASANLRATVVRPFLTYGPGQTHHRLVPTAIRAALRGEGFDATDGTQTRELNHVDDMALGFVAAGRPEAEGQLFNLGGGEEHSMRNVVQTIYALVGADPKAVRWGVLKQRDGEVDRFFGDHSLSQSVLHHFPRIGLEDGLRATIAWWRSSEALED
jgi:nucleoside-diphosphate-sugar epimerase